MDCVIILFVGFDSHLLLRDIECFDRLSVIPINKEQVLGVKLCDYSDKETRPRINIMDSMSFLSGSLDKLSSRLVADGNEMKMVRNSSICKDQNGEFSAQKYKLLTRKGKFILFDNLSHVILRCFPV